jgi:hypothetical protein
LYRKLKEKKSFFKQGGVGRCVGEETDAMGKIVLAIKRII